MKRWLPVTAMTKVLTALAKQAMTVLVCLFSGSLLAASVETTGKLSGYSFDGVYRHFQMEGISHFCGPSSHDRAVLKLRDTKTNYDKQLRAAYYAGNTVTIRTILSPKDYNECKILSVQVYRGRQSIRLEHVVANH